MKPEEMSSKCQLHRGLAAHGRWAANRCRVCPVVTHHPRTWLRQAIDDGYVDPARTVQIGLRGTAISVTDQTSSPTLPMARSPTTRGTHQSASCR
jgi:hypothetical protein